MSKEDGPAGILPRRSVLGGIAVGLIASHMTTTPPWAFAAPGTVTADDFAGLRLRYRELISVTTTNTNDPHFVEALRRVDAQTSQYRALIDQSPSPLGVFTDRPLLPGTVTDPYSLSLNMAMTYGYLKTMTDSYVTPGGQFTGDGQLLTEILNGLAAAHELRYNTDSPIGANWYHFAIQGPRALLDCCTLLYSQIPAADRANYLAAVQHYVPDPWIKSGSDRVQLCLVVVTHGMLAEQSARIARARDALAPVLTYARPDPDKFYGAQQGFWLDGSFLYHGYGAQTGSYGVDLLGAFATLLSLLAGSAWPVSNPNVVLDSIEKSFEPVIFDGLVMDFVRGRSVCRQDTIDHGQGSKVIEHILQLAPAVDAERAAAWRSRCRGWIDRKNYSSIYAGAPLLRVARINALLADTTVVGAPEPTGPVVFPMMGRAVHRGPGWAFAVALASKHTSNYIYLNGENELGFHTGSGMTYLYNSDGGQFTDGFWPTINLYGLPGTTLDQQPLERGAGGLDTGKTLAPNAWAGGVTLENQFGSAGMDYHGIESTLRARKSWFFLPDSIVALGAAITGGSGQPIITTIESRNLHTNGTNPLTIDGIAQPNTQGWTGQFNNAKWAHLADVAGYVLLDQHTPLIAARAARTGTWRENHARGSEQPVTRRYVTLHLNHGVAPAGSTYAYRIIPGATADETAGHAFREDVVVLSNTSAVQAIQVGSTAVVAANFFAAATISAPTGHTVTTDGATAVIMRLTPNRQLEVAIADPTIERVTLILNLGGIESSSVAGDETVTVTPGPSGLEVRVDTSAHDGRTHRLTVHDVPPSLWRAWRARRTR